MPRGVCQACGQAADTTCDMCGAQVCHEHKNRIGCAVCGGETTID